MARPSGLASDHHPEGPGDAPRRRKYRKTTPSADRTQGSKRAASPSNVQSSPAPKRKRMQSDDLDQLARETEESVTRGQSQPSDAVSVRKSIIRHTRRMSEPVVAFADDEDDEDEMDELQWTPTASTQPMPGLTPHLQRIGAPRGRPTNAARRRARMSMPAQFRVHSVDEANGSQIQFAPFKATIDSRTRRRLKRNHLADEWNELEDHQKEDKKLRRSYIELKRQLDEKNKQIEDLEYQIEARRLGEINLTDDETDGLREQLSQARQQIEDLRASSVYRGDSREMSTYDGNMDFDYDDDDEFLAIDPNDPEGPDMEETEPLPNGEYATRVLALSSQVTVDSLNRISETSHDVLTEASQQTSIPDKISDKAVKRYEAEIERLIEVVAEAQGALRVVTIELQNANILQPGASTDEILVELRHSFEDLREEMENLVPDCTVGLTNGEFLRKLPTLFAGLLSELGEKTTAAEKYYQESCIMRTQFENTMNLLERSEARNDKLDAKIAGLEQNNENLRVEIADLEERVATLDALTNQQDIDLKMKDTQILGLENEIEDRETSLTRLRTSLEKYRADLDNVTETATRTEEQLQQTILDMQQVHDAEVLELQTQFQDENEARLQAQGEAEQKSEYIEELESHLQRIEDNVKALTEDLEQLRTRLTVEVEEHSQTKTLLQEEQDRTYEQQNQIENLEEQLKQLETELADTRSSLEAERAQREQTEIALNEANEKIDDLQERLRSEGLESQGLRSKLFQAQMEREEQVKKLEGDAHERETELENALSAETQNREIAEQTIADLENRITQLEEDIAARDDELTRLAQELTETEQDRDEQITTLKNQLADLKLKYAALENTSNSTITTLQANITDLTNEVKMLRDGLNRLEAEAADAERTLKDELAQKDQEMAEKDQLYAELQDKYAQLDEEHSRAIDDFASEQFSFNKLQEKFIRGQKTMEDKIKALDAQIRELQALAAQRTLDHEALVVEKEDEIRDLQITADSRSAVIAELQTNIDTLQTSFTEAEADTRRTIDNLLDSQRLLQQQNEDMAEDLKKRNTEALEAAHAVKVKGLSVKAQNTDLRKVIHGKVTKASERVKVGKKGRKAAVKERKWRDSGFGADSDIENEEVDIDVVRAGPEAIVG